LNKLRYRIDFHFKAACIEQILITFFVKFYFKNLCTVLEQFFIYRKASIFEVLGKDSDKEAKQGLKPLYILFA
jgi:hypothetical protein